ncbi:MAG: patatin-like phospholipase family protein [Gemmatimonadaceae bacterium]
MTALLPERIALVLGGGGLKGFAHIGVLRALEERGVVPSLLAGTSIGALIAAAAAGGTSVGTMEERALAVRRRDVFRLNRLGMVRDRQRAVSIYLEAPLRELCEAVAPAASFDELDIPVLVNTVDLEQAAQVVWGLPGLRDVHVPDAVYASCALPGFFPPGIVAGRVCADGGIIDNLPVTIAAQGMDAVIAVDVGSAEIIRREDILTHGFGSIYMRAASSMMHALQLVPLMHWAGPPMLLIRPKVSHIGWFSFSRTSELISAGYDAASEALDFYDSAFEQESGVYPRRDMRIEVDKAKCIGCGLCAALAPDLMGMGTDGKAFSRERVVSWSPADGDFVHHCPTFAIAAERVGAEPATALEGTQANETVTSD